MRAVRRAGSIGVLLVLVACAKDGGTPRAQQIWVPDGDPVNCITLRQIRSTHVVDDDTIQFFINSRRMFQNDLPNRCPGLSFSRAFRHNSRTQQLCSVDTITVIQPGPGPQGATCMLGRFQPLKPMPAPQG